MTRYRPLRFARYILIVALVALVPLVKPGKASAQSPSPTYESEDNRPGGGLAQGASMMVVEGVGSIGCPYSQDSVTSWTGYWVNNGYQTVTEISPQTRCGTVSQYENLIQTIYNDVANLPNGPADWGGIMLDEEAAFNFTPAQLAQINSYTSNLMANSPGGEWWYSEDQPNSWDAGTYNYLLFNSFQAPQVYNQNFANAVNNECSSYNNCVALVTVWSYASAPWNDWGYAINAITGYAYQRNYGYWYNVFVGV